MTEEVVLVGLPATGKTSYLALLFHAIVEDRADGLRLGRFDEDRDHVTEISDVLLASQVADHTLTDDDQNVTLSLAAGDEEFVLKIPDLSGETWEHALVDRRWSRTLDDAIAGAAGFMVFVHCKEINGGTTIVDVEVAAALLGEDSADEIDAAARGTGEEASLEEAHCRQLTQVSLVDLIQFFARRSSRPIRVAVMISAWDLEPKRLKPSDWLTKNAPLLDQFFQINADEVEATVWGVSAQGANLADERVRAQFKDKDPIDRARVHAADGTRMGVAAPLRWILRLGQ